MLMYKFKHFNKLQIFPAYSQKLINLFLLYYQIEH
jgi:hypothetical protein